MDDDYTAQFCADGQAITSWPSRERDATEVRIWAPDGTLIIAAEKRADGWHVSGSDEINWTLYADEPHRTFRDALEFPYVKVNEVELDAVRAALAA